MTPAAQSALIAIVAVGVVSAAIGSYGVRVARSTSDFLVASRTVGPVVNASAISGEYLSAASFLGIAALILREGADALWYPVAFVAGYLALLLFVAAPLRRSGAYTVPDFAEARLASPLLRKVCTVFVLVIGWLYLLPQLQGAGLALTTLTTLPAWSGVAAAGVVVLLTVVGGGMRSITFVQAFQYWLKLTALLVPAIVVLGIFLSEAHTFDRPSAPDFPADTTVAIRTDVVLEVVEPVALTATGQVDGVPVDGPLLWEPGRHEVLDGAQLVFAGGSPVPTVAGTPATDAEWLEPMSGESDHQLLEIYSILIAGFLGTMGLPHVLVRFYTNPDGRAARRTTVSVLAMIGAFYMLVTVVGWLALFVTRLDFSLTVPLVFAVAASTFCPLLVMGIWWRGLTATGAVAGVLVGGVSSGLATAVTMVVELPPGVIAVLLNRPAAVTVPAAFLTMIVVSLRTRAQVPADVDRVLLRLHAPERLGLSQDRLDDDPDPDPATRPEVPGGRAPGPPS